MNYLIFGGDNYYPLGGMRDLIGCASTIQKAREMALTRTVFDWWHIVDAHTLQIVEQG